MLGKFDQVLVAGFQEMTDVDIFAVAEPATYPPAITAPPL